MNNQKNSLQKKITVANSNQSPADSSSSKNQIMTFVLQYAKMIMLAELVLIVGLGYVLFLHSKIQHITEVSTADIAEWENKLQITKSNFESAQALVNLYNSLGANEIAKLEKILPKSAQIPELMAQLEALFVATDVYMTDFTVAPVDFGEGAVMPFEILQFQISFSATESYQDFKDILSKLETNMRLLNIQSFSYSQGEEGYTVEGFVYFSNL